jgi:hypothetical protein
VEGKSGSHNGMCVSSPLLRPHKDIIDRPRGEQKEGGGGESSDVKQNISGWKIKRI